MVRVPCMDPVVVGSRDGMGPRTFHDVVVGSRRLGRGHVVGSVHNGGHRSIRGVEGYDHDIRGESSHVVVDHGDRTHQLDMGDVLESGNEHGRCVGYPAGSLWSVSVWFLAGVGWFLD